MNYTTKQIAETCRQLGPTLGPLPAEIDGTQLLWAIAGNESGFGRDTQPRHEPGYDVGGKYATNDPMPELLSHYGHAAACSYGPWQVMLASAPAGYAPSSFDDLVTAGQAAVYCLNFLLRHFRPVNLCEIGECYNAGHEIADPGYTDKLTTNYRVPLAGGLASVKQS